MGGTFTPARAWPSVAIFTRVSSPRWWGDEPELDGGAAAELDGDALDDVAVRVEGVPAVGVDGHAAAGIVLGGVELIGQAEQAAVLEFDLGDVRGDELEGGDELRGVRGVQLHGRDDVHDLAGEGRADRSLHEGVTRSFGHEPSRGSDC